MIKRTFPYQQAILGVALVLLVVLGAQPLLPLRVVAADAPAVDFSAERAMADLQVVARQPHAAGSDAQAQVRAAILEQAAALDLEAETQESGQIINILVRIPGSDPTGTLLVTGHYDSHPPAPGGGDNGLAVAAMLESMRVLKAGGPLRNEILFLFTDGEEMGYLGAIAYIRADPGLADRIGVVLCFDGRPGNAMLRLLETSPGDGWLMRQVRGLRLPLQTGSWSNGPERAEQSNDFDIFSAAGFTGLYVENEGAGTRYHTERDTAEAISLHQIQAYGQTMLALIGRLGETDLGTRTEGPDMIYFNAPLAGLVVHPGWLLSVLGGLALAALLVLIMVSWKRKVFSTGRFLLCAAGILLGIALIILGAQGAWGLITKAHAAEIEAFGGFEGSAGWLGGMMMVGSLLLTALFGILGRKLGELNMAMAALLVYLLTRGAAYLFMEADPPLMTAYIIWPFLGGVGGLAVLLFTRHPVWKTILMALAALPFMVLMVPYIAWGTFTREAAWLPLLVLGVSILPLAPQIAALLGKSTATNQRVIKHGNS